MRRSSRCPAGGFPGISSMWLLWCMTIMACSHKFQRHPQDSSAGECRGSCGTARAGDVSCIDYANQCLRRAKRCERQCPLEMSLYNHEPNKEDETKTCRQHTRAMCAMVRLSTLKRCLFGYAAHRAVDTNCLKASVLKRPYLILSAISGSVKYWCAISTCMKSACANPLLTSELRAHPLLHLFAPDFHPSVLHGFHI